MTEPKEIDLEAIAYYVGARVRYRPLDGCEARIVGDDRNAIITVNSNSQRQRQRFSIAHELGHWQHHRGKRLACKVEDFQPRNKLSPERTADIYAADLLFPNYLFRPMARQAGRVSFKAIYDLAEKFDTSLTATAIRYVESDTAPIMLVCHGPHGRKWFTKAPSVPQRWFPQDVLDTESFAFDVQFGGKRNDLIPHKIGADAWFDRQEARYYELLEQTVRVNAFETLTLIVIDDPRMIEESGRA